MFADAAILLVGDEILQGVVMDANIPSISHELARRGLRTAAAAVASDEAGSIARSLASLRSPGRLIVVSGGLGPTEDDLTPGSIAEALGLEYVENRAALRMIEEKYAGRESGCPASALRQARMPYGARPVGNPAGIAPGMVLDIPGTHECIVMLPGVPREVEALISPCLDEAGASGDGPSESRCLRVWGIPENALMDIIESEGLACGAALSYLPKYGQVELVFKGPAAPAAFEAVRSRLAGSVFSETRGEPIELVLGRALARNGTMLATAESCTGGMLGGRITSVPGSSEWFAGGVVCYSNDMKIRVLGVRPSTIDAFGAVSAETASEMAAGVMALSGASAALAVTGVAGPGGGTESRPVGTVWIAAVTGGAEQVREFRLGGTRAVIRESAATRAMGMLLGMLGGPSG